MSGSGHQSVDAGPAERPEPVRGAPPRDRIASGQRGQQRGSTGRAGGAEPVGRGQAAPLVRVVQVALQGGHLRSRGLPVTVGGGLATEPPPVMAPHRLPVAAILALVLRPRRLRRVPARPHRLLHAREQELDHQPRVRAPVGQAAVEQVVVDDGDRAGRPLQRLLGVQPRSLGQVLRARHHRARTHVERRVLRVVEGHRPAAVVVAAVAVHGVAAVAQTVLVDGLRVAAGPVVVHVAVQVQVVAAAQDAGERPGDAGMVEYPAQRGNAWQRVVER